MSIYYYGALVDVYNPKQKETSIPTLVGDIIKTRQDYDTYKNAKPQFVVRHYQENQ